MYELIQVSEHDYYIQCPAASGDLQYPFQCGSYRRKQISPGQDRVQDLRAGHRMRFYQASCFGAGFFIWRLSLQGPAA